MKKLFILAAVAAVGMTACMQENGDRNTVSNRAVTMRATIDKTDASRASAMTIERFSSFHAIAFKNNSPNPEPYINTAVWKDLNEGWKYSPKAYYPADGEHLDFYAYSPIGDSHITELQLNYDDVWFRYTVPANQREDMQSHMGDSGVAEDLLVSNVLDQSGGEVSFVFEHALSSAFFFARNENDPKSELVYVIKEIAITELKASARFVYNTASSPEVGQWDEYDHQIYEYIAPLPESGVALEPGMADRSLLTKNDFLIILPQMPDNWGAPYSGGTMVRIIYSLRDGSGQFIHGGDQEWAERYFEIPSHTQLRSEGFLPGRRYDFTFTFKASEEIRMTVSDVSLWDNRPTEINPLP